MFFHSNLDNTQLYYNSFIPARYDKVLIIAHGYAEYFERYSDLIDFLNANNIAVYGFDHRGHGDSEGQRAHVMDFKEYSEDLNQFIDLVSEETKMKPILFAHSMGSVIALSYMQNFDQSKLSALILSGVFMKTVSATKPYLILLAKIFSNIYPRLSVSLKFNTEGTCSDAEVVKRAREDKKMFGVASARWGTEILKTVEETKKLSHFEIPTLFVHGENDQINEHDAAYAFYKKLKIEKKEFISFKKSMHEIHADVEKEQFKQDLLKWITK